MSRWLVGSSRISTFEPDCTRIASDSRWRSPPDSASSGFSASSPLNRKRPSSARALAGVSPVAVLAGLEHGARVAAVQILGVLREEPDLDVVTGAQLAGDQRSRRLGPRLGGDRGA